jgi:hypothetical protein
MGGTMQIFDIAAKRPKRGLTAENTTLPALFVFPNLIAVATRRK